MKSDRDSQRRAFRAPGVALCAALLGAAPASAEPPSDAAPAIPVQEWRDDPAREWAEERQNQPPRRRYEDDPFAEGPFEDEIFERWPEHLRRLAPLLRDFAEILEDPPRYHPPEMLPNGDIIIRRRQDSRRDAPEREDRDRDGRGRRPKDGAGGLIHL